MAQDVMQEVLNDLKETGMKAPKLVTMLGGDYFPAIITGISSFNNEMIVDMNDINTHQSKRVIAKLIKSIVVVQ